MDFGSPSKPSSITLAPVTPRADIVATPGSVAVELPPEKTVQSAQAGEAVKLDIRQPSAQDRGEVAGERRTAERRDDDLRRAQDVRSEDAKSEDVADEIERRLVIEPRTRSLVLQKRNLETGETVQTMPDEATLKLRILNLQSAERARAARENTARSIELTA